MARYTGPKTRISRRYGVLISGSPKAFERKAYPPGQHGPRSRRKLTEYAVALAEKQKLRHQYGVLERQFRRYFDIARRRRGVTGETLLQLLETRLDNIVYRLGLSKTLRGARQLVAHGHVTVNGRKCDVPSRNLRAGDVVSIKDRAGSKTLAQRGLEATQIVTVPDWLLLDKDNLSGTVVRVPSRDDINPVVNEQLVVELYSK